MSVADAIAVYHDLLTDQLAADSQGAMDEQLRRRGLLFGERPLCTVLRPRLLTPTQLAYLERESRILLGAFATAYQAAIRDSGFRAQFGLLDWEETLVHHDPGFRDPSPTSRLDAFFVDESSGMHLTEYNAETPAGLAYGDALSELFLTLPIMGAYLQRYALHPLPARQAVLHPLLDAFAQWRGTRERPSIGILDWREVPTYSEFVLFQKYFHACGIDCVIADPREVEYRGGKLTSEGEDITLIYKRVLISELVQQGGLDHPVMRAVRDGAVCMVNPFRCKILHKKASLSVLSDENNARLFSREELAAIAAHIPWTRTVAERRTTHEGREVDLVPFIQRNRRRLVLKPNDEYGGKGIVLGWEVDDAAWEDAIRTALAEPYIVQEKIALPSEPYPSLVDGSVTIVDRLLDTAPFVSYGRYIEGCMTRLSTVALLNVTAGGGSTVPVFVATPRS
ncbi:MAG TPA: hypothetical protein VJ812_15540 [Gemmatimonadaceae bacterium]|jgi:hypothetical protein|nr:hypothetical protein [Gemmatimonadaceae bacterium]